MAKEGRVQVRIVRPVDRFGVDIHMIWSYGEFNFPVVRNGAYAEMRNDVEPIKLGERYKEPLISMPDECFEALKKEILMDEHTVSELENENIRLRQINLNLMNHLEDMRKVAFQALGITIADAPPPFVAPTTTMAEATRLGPGRMVEVAQNTAFGRSIGQGVMRELDGNPTYRRPRPTPEVSDVQEGQAGSERPTWPEGRREAAEEDESLF